MSRSIHVTANDLNKVAYHDYADAAQKRTVQRTLRQQWRKKLMIKGLVEKERREALPDELPPVLPDTIPVICRDASRFVNYPASIEDVRAVLRLLPPGILTGLTSIELCLGDSFQRLTTDNDCLYDPFTKRASSEILPGIYEGKIFGTYFVSSQ